MQSAQALLQIGIAVVDAASRCACWSERCPMSGLTLPAVLESRRTLGLDAARCGALHPRVRSRRAERQQGGDRVQLASTLRVARCGRVKNGSTLSAASGSTPRRHPGDETAASAARQAMNRRGSPRPVSSPSSSRRAPSEVAPRSPGRARSARAAPRPEKRERSEVEDRPPAPPVPRRLTRTGLRILHRRDALRRNQFPPRSAVHGVITHRQLPQAGKPCLDLLRPPRIGVARRRATRMCSPAHVLHAAQLAALRRPAPFGERGGGTSHVSPAFLTTEDDPRGVGPSAVGDHVDFARFHQACSPDLLHENDARPTTLKTGKCPGQGVRCALTGGLAIAAQLRVMVVRSNGGT